MYNSINPTPQDQAWLLAERLKEMRCLYGLLDLAQNHPLSTTEFLEQAVQLLPPAFQYPEAISAMIEYKGAQFLSGQSQTNPPNLCAEIKNNGKACGFVKVSYCSPFPEAYEGPFLKEERHLLNAFCFELSQSLERRQVDEELRMLASVFENSYAGIMISDAHNRIVRVNQAFTSTTGYSADEALGQNPNFLTSQRQDQAFYQQMWQTLHQQDFWRGEVWNRRKDGEVYAEILSISIVRNQSGEIQYYIGVFSDISSIKANEAALIHLAHYDPLTGLPNRRLLQDRLDQGLGQVKRHQQKLMLCFLDLDGFKPINDDYGHETGDQVLVEVAKRLQAQMRESDTLARLGGDEFVLLMLDVQEEAQIEKRLTQLIKQLEAPIQTPQAKVEISCSLGAVCFPQAGLLAEQLLTYADQAMYRAKQAGKAQIRFYHHEN